MTRLFQITLLVFSMLLFCRVASAEVEKWEFDKDHSNIYFEVRHTYVTVRGKFDDFSGELRFEPQRMEVGRITFKVNTKSVNTGIPSRDNHLRSDEFFAVGKYPSMIFQSSGVKKKEGDQYIVEGNLTIKGKTNKVAVPFTFLGSRENPLSKGQVVAGFEARFSINRLDYQVGPGRYVEMGVIGNKVDILIALEVVKPIK